MTNYSEELIEIVIEAMDVLGVNIDIDYLDAEYEVKVRPNEFSKQDVESIHRVLIEHRISLVLRDWKVSSYIEEMVFVTLYFTDISGGWDT